MAAVGNGLGGLGWRDYRRSHAIASGANRLDVLVRGTTGAVFHSAWDGAGWQPSKTGWEELGGQIVGVPAATSWGPNRLDILVRGLNNELFHKAWNGVQWLPSNTRWEDLGGHISADPVVTSWAPNRLDVIVHGSDGARITSPGMARTGYAL